MEESYYEMDDTNDDTLVDPMDTNWINDYEADEKCYSMFYPEPASEIKVNIIYTNKKNEIEKISEKMIYLPTENVIKKEDLLRVIKNTNTIDNVKYSLISILVYNITLDHRELKSFLTDASKYEFITNLKNIEDYELQSTINYLQDLNTVYIVYTEEKQKTKSSDLANTKRVRFNIMQKKTRRRKH